MIVDLTLYSFEQYKAPPITDSKNFTIRLFNTYGERIGYITTNQLRELFKKQGLIITEAKQTH